MPIIVVILYTAKGFGGYIQAYFISYIGQDITRIVRDKLFSHVLKLDLDFFQKIHGGELVSRIINDINRIQSAVSGYLAEIIRESLTIVALVALVIYRSPELAFYGLIVLPLAFSGTLSGFVLFFLTLRAFGFDKFVKMFKNY